MSSGRNERQELSNLPGSIRSLCTGYLVVIGIGLLMAGAQVLLRHGLADGKLGIAFT